jgi:hypothetical protein
LTAQAGPKGEKKMSDGDSRGFTIVVTTGLLALIGTVAGGLVEGYWARELAQQEFQSDLILRALEPENPDDRLSSLTFIVDAGLISDSELSERLREMVDDDEVQLPRFGGPIVARQVDGAVSAKGRSGLKDDEESGKFYALSGLIVRHGDIIDAITPIFAEVSVGGSIEGEKVGDRFGGTGGGVTRLERPGHLITEVSMIRGDYFGAAHVIHIEVVWQKLTPEGLDPTKVRSKRLGGGSYAKNLRPATSYQAQPGHYISDLQLPPSLRHTSGEVYLTDLVAEYKPLVLMK